GGKTTVISGGGRVLPTMCGRRMRLAFCTWRWRAVRTRTPGSGRVQRTGPPRFLAWGAGTPPRVWPISGPRRRRTRCLRGRQVRVHGVLADAVARFQGEGIAAVVAVDAYTAADAAAAIDVDYEPLPAVTDPWQAAQHGAPLVHPDLADAPEDGNIVFRMPIRAGDYAAAQA